MNEIKKVAIYCRVSTEEQATEGYSIAAQLQTLRHYSQLYGWEVAEEYVDEGISGKNIKGRPAMRKLVADVETNKFQAVIVWKISRLSRNMLDTLNLLDKFEYYGVKFISYSENFDTGTPIGRLVVQLMASIAEMERNTLAENVKLGMKQRALEGLWNGGVVFGYDHTEKKMLVINQKEAAVVRLIYTLYADGKGLKAIANHLNKAGHRTKRNRYFSINGVAQILDNPVYIGKIRWLQFENWDTQRRRGKNPNPIRVDGKHEAIISDELWSIVQARRKSRSFKQRQSNEPFLLSGLLRCPDCGQGMVPSITTRKTKDGEKRKYRYYVCGDFHNKGSAACKSNSIKAYDAEDLVIKRIETFLSKKRLYKTLQDINSNSVGLLSQLNKELESIEERLTEIESLQDRYMEAFEKNTLPTSILQDRLQKVSNEKGELEQRKNEIAIQLGSNDSKVIQPELIETLLERFLSSYKKTSRENKKQLLQHLINHITIKQLKDNSRTVKEIELDFDFTEINLSKTFTLIHLLYRETDNEHTFSIPASDKELPPYLQKFLPLFMVRFIPINSKGTIYLL
ncbi:recombinase family protein [Pallidibacillus thermolactis]|jgi:site-specific DNA recombinase|uniref:recombinase family protein n=1 Tax=Pallidibacillus thermolactis TaxID=251051 RepID=UPI0021D985CB|nr:recombinase family protein [Pallidibacillus thermolactis]MCU9602249.1 recombinase family protein [Pallidibacillus thermolactis subsp. kokeshiiformis]MED1672854.1 recombinase family protein [Pallidibacillus thermolactis subsp. kokeshiiformis]